MEQRIEIERLEEAANLFGSFDENIRLIESEFHVSRSILGLLLSSSNCKPTSEPTLCNQHGSL